MPRRLVAALAVALVPSAALAQPAAQQEPEEPAGPEVRTAQGPAEPAPDRRGPRTHGILFATGHLLEAGQVQGALRGYGFWSSARVGLHDRVELGAQAVLFLGAGVGARVALTEPSSPLSALVSGSIWWVGDDQPGSLQLGGTLGYTADRLNIHSTVSEMPLDGERAWAANAGLLWEVSSGISLGLDAGRFSVDDDLLRGVAMGFKATGTYFDVDVAVIWSPELSEEMPVFPIVGLTGRS